MNIQELANNLSSLYGSDKWLEGAEIQEIHVLSSPYNGIRVFGYAKDTSFFERAIFFSNKSNISLVDRAEV